MSQFRPAHSSWLIAFLFLAGGMLSATGCATSSAPRDRTTLRVLTWNIHHGEGVDGNFDLIRLANIIRSLDVDLVALQEVDRTTGRSGWRDQALELASLLKMYHVYGAAMPYDRGEYGEAILSRWPIHRAETIQLPKIEGSEPRALLIAEVDNPVTGPLRFAATHLAHDSELDRLEQARLIVQHLRESDRPTILAGDLNAQPDAPPMQLLFEHFIDSHQQDPRDTYPALEPSRRIDYILFSPNDGWHVLDASVIAGNIASDHCLVVTELDYRP